MEHVVFFPAHDGSPAFRRVANLQDAVRLVEHLRNVEGVNESSVHALSEVPLAFKPYYRVEVPAGIDDAPAEAPAEVPAPLAVQAAEPVPAPIAVAPTPSVVPVIAPLAAVADAPVVVAVPEQAEAPAEAAEPVAEEEPVKQGAASLGFFAS
jgi:hypothetical protein